MRKRSSSVLFLISLARSVAFIAPLVFLFLTLASFVLAPPSVPPVASKIQSLLKARNFVRAERMTDSLVRAGDTSAFVRESLSIALLGQHKQLERAEQLLNELRRTPYRLYLLAKIQCLEYKFQAAIDTYQSYIPVADKLLLSDIEAKQNIIECKNALQLVETCYRPVLYEKSRTGWDSLATIAPLAAYPYRLIPLPAALYGAYDDAAIQPPSLVAYPSELQIGARVVYTNRKSKHGQRDLYFVELRTNNVWTPPADLGTVINTPFDEAFGLLSDDGLTLYFSSCGHYGMGGFDIFRTTYDPVLRQWKSPENLGFPYNSPYDDYLLGLPDAYGRIVLASNRGIAADSLQLFTLSYDPEQMCEALHGTANLAERALFQFTAQSTPSESVREVRTTANQNAREKHYREVDSDEEYQKALQTGYSEQQRADSIRKDLTILRERLWNVTTSEARKALEVRITSLENEMLTAQRKADINFGKASQIEQYYITGQRTLINQENQTGAYMADAPSALHLAKPASSVMQSTELKALAEIARQYPTYRKETQALWQQYATIRHMLEDSTSSTVKISKAEQEAARQSQIYVTKYKANIKTRRRIFSQCLAVAYMKGNREAKKMIFAAEEKAKEYHILAQTLLNNRSVQDEGEAAFFASLAEELGNMYYEVAFAYAWNMDAYRKKMNKSIAQYEELLSVAAPNVSVSDAKAAPESELVQLPPSVVRPTPNTTVPTVPAGVTKLEGLQLLSPSPYSTEDDIPRDIEQPSGVVYRLQLGAYSNPIDPSLFMGMYPIIAETLQGGKIRKYYAGAFQRKEQADKGKQITTQKGFPDAFVVAWYNGRKVTLARAASLENETSVVQKEAEKPTEGVGSTYQVTIGTFDGDLPSYVSETVNLLAPGKEIQNRSVDNGRNLYFVGGFSEKIQAERLRDNFLASGFIESTIQLETKGDR